MYVYRVKNSIKNFNVTETSSAQNQSYIKPNDAKQHISYKISVHIFHSESKTDPQHDSHICVCVYCFEVGRVKFIRRHHEPFLMVRNTTSTYTQKRTF